MSESNGTSSENDIAIVGMAMRVPGANTPQKFWENVRDGVESVRQLSEEELLEGGESPEALRHPDYVRATGSLDDMEMFDGEFFGFSPKESAILDPQHRHFTECCWEALEDAGHPPEKFEGQVGLFAGCGMGSYFYFNICSNKDLVDSVGLFLLRHTGNDKDFLATRVSYLLDLKGPSVNVQTACSTSLVATHMACQSLLSGESDMALAGGVTILLPHNRGYIYHEGEVLSPDGHCHAFDHRAQGTVLTSGTGVVVLRRLEDALEDGDHVYAVIRGSAVNNDGGSKVGYLAPSVDGQAQAMSEAYAVSEVDPRTLGYIECHGTGTYMGDPIEISALTQAFRQHTDDTGFCRLASVKTNIGHLDTAAGVAGLIKASLCLYHEKIAPTIGYEAPNPEIDFDSTPFVVNDRLFEWPRGREPRRAAINSLGVGGTNAHVIVEEAPPAAETRESDREHQLLLLSARNNKALEGNTQRLAAFLREHPEVPLADVAYTLDVGRRAFDRRRVVAVEDREQAIEFLESGNPRRLFTHSVGESQASVAFMFSGAGTQYPRMAAELYEKEPVFREHMDRGIALLESKTGKDFKKLFFAEPDQLEEAEAEFEITERQLPAIFVLEVALAELWKSWGIEPEVMIGHSMGENTAACIAGVLSYEDTLDLMILRGVLTTKAPAGAMTSVALSPEELKPMLEGEIDLAIINTPQLCVASGAVDAVEALERKLEEQDIDFRRLPVPVAGHSRMFEPILDEFRAFLRSRSLRAPQIPFVSNRTGKLITDEQATDPDYWVEHLRHTVFFADGIATLLSKPGRVLIEIGPGQALCSFAKQHPSARQDANVIPTMRHRDDTLSDSAYFVASLGRCWASGLDMELDRLREGESRRRVPLPTYAWSHQRYFIEPAAAPAPGEDLTNLERIGDIADWAHVPVWERAVATRTAENKHQTWLLFMDEAGLGRRLRKRLLARGHTVVCVESGDAFFKKSEDSYALAPERGRAGYDALVQDLVAHGRVPTHIAHLWLVTDRERFRPGSSFFHQNLQDGFYSLYFLAQALGDENVPTPLHIDVITNGMQSVGEGDPLLHPEKATVLGPVKVIPRELPGVTCRSIDVRLPVRPENTLAGLVSSIRKRGESGAETLDGLADLLEAELSSECECEVTAYRDGERFVRRYRAQRLAKAAPEAGSALREGGTYLITGGLGGLGLTMAERLATELKAKLVLVGRTPLPDREEWEDWLRSRGGDDVVGRKIRKIQELERAGAEVLVLAADVTNHDQMRDAFQRARERFGAVHGVIHTAGVVKDELIQLKLESDIADVFSPKIHGTVVLDSLLEEAGVELFVLFSSTSSIAAPAGQIDYVAANAFLDAYAQQHAGGPVRTVAINWGIWNDVGMAAESFGRSDEATPALESRMKPPRHPLFETREKDSHGRTVFGKTYSPQSDWVLDEHRTLSGHAVLPGTGYPELARAALVEYDEAGPFEICDLYFLRPLYVPDGETRDVRVSLGPNERGYRFEVRTKCQLEGRTAWELNAQASIEYGHLQSPSPLDLAQIDARCQKSRSDVDPSGHKSGQENHVRFGPRWRVLRQVFYGDGEALAELELPAAFASDLPAFGLHPALLDYSTGYAMELIKGYVGAEALWVPVSYGRFAVYDTLPRRVFSWVRNHAENRADRDFAVFDVTICDETGRVLVEIEEFTIHKLAESIDFGVSQAPTRADVEFEAVLGRGNERDLSPAELRLRRNYERGIKPEEGSEALARVVAGEAHPQVVVSSLDLDQLMRQVELSTDESRSGGARFERPELDSEFVEARDEIERTLVGFWEELLGVENLGVCDSFFDLGGHSLIAVRLFAMIKKAYHVEFPISVLFEAPTIERCADLIREAIGEEAAGASGAATPASETRRTRYKYLVAMHQGEGGSKPPFFLVAGMFGNVLNLRHLANLVGGDRPFYGLQARGLYGDEPPHETFEEMAEAYIGEMRTVQPHGPYYVGGFSGGGLTAFEIAHQLLAAGEEVALLLLLDSRLPQTPRLTKLDRAKIQWQRLKQRGPGYAIDWARNRMKWQIEQIQARFDRGEDLGHTEDQFHNAAIEAAFRGALPRYRMKKFPGKLVLFRPRLDEAYVLGEDRIVDSAKEWVWYDNGFGQYAESIDVFEMPGDHDSMVLEPNVRVMAKQLDGCIAEAAARVASKPPAASTAAASDSADGGDVRPEPDPAES